jgi:hypothetical protein
MIYQKKEREKNSQTIDAQTTSEHELGNKNRTTSEWICKLLVIPCPRV